MNPDIIRIVQHAIKATGRKASRPVLNKSNLAVLLLGGRPKPALYGGQLRANLEDTGVKDIEVEERKVTLLVGANDSLVTTYVCARFTSEQEGARYTFTVDPIGVVTITLMT